MYFGSAFYTLSEPTGFLSVTFLSTAYAEVTLRTMSVPKYQLLLRGIENISENYLIIFRK